MLKKELSILLSINDDIASIKAEKELLQTIFIKLRDFYNFRSGGISLFDEKKENLGMIVGSINNVENALFPNLWFRKFSKNEIPFEIPTSKVGIIKMDTKYLDSFQKLTAQQPELIDVFKEIEDKFILLIPMKTGGELIGVMSILMNEEEVEGTDQEAFIKIANIIASTINNARLFSDLKRKEEEKAMQLELVLTIARENETEKLFLKLAEEINKLIPCDYIALFAQAFDVKQINRNLSRISCFIKEIGSQFRVFPNTRTVDSSILKMTSEKDRFKETGFYEYRDSPLQDLMSTAPHFKVLAEDYAINSVLVFQYGYEDIGELNLIIGRSKPHSFSSDELRIDLLFTQDPNSYFSVIEIERGLRLLPDIGLILANVYAFEEVRTLTKNLEQEKSFLLDEINLTNNFQEIIGNSLAIQSTLNKVTQVALLDSTVLIQGETGTGKELIVRAIHNLSKRKDNAFITVNCAALPAQLIESELFGHEKGSFTGAIERKLGKFEVANGGTIFLDEIGELPLEVQAKLLRVLQEKEFERLGGKSIISSDVRVVAATNRDLEKEVELGKFRNDLFYRLNVFPITVPPLRDRVDDIPLLVKHFIEKYSKRIGKEVKSIKKKDLDYLKLYNWPGNVRELEYLIERALIISEGSTINLAHLQSENSAELEQNPETFQTLFEMEKGHIMTALKLANGKVTGVKGASELLGIKGKTLGSKMRKLGIKREVIITEK